MQKLLISIVGTAISFAITQYLIAGFMLDTKDLVAYLITAILFLVVNALTSPLLKLVFLPINILTLGLFRWIINILVLYLFDLVYGGITISAYNFAGFNSPFFTLPPAYISLFFTLLLSSMVMSFTYSLFTSFFRD